MPMILAALLLLQTTVSAEIFEDSVVPVCYRDRTPIISMDKVLVLRNPKIDGKANGFSYNVEISGETVMIAGLTDGASPKSFNGSYFFNKKDNLDVDLFAAMIDKRLYIYWEEIVRHRGKRFGLMQIVNGSPRDFCTGLTASIIQH
jgi:hypothetical protein